MKRFLLIPILALSFTITVCAQSGGTQNNSGQTAPQGKKNLIVFYSWSGNSRTIANNLRSITGGDIVEITPATPYTTNYNQMLDVARQEITAIDNTGSYPAINNPAGDITGYDTVFIIYPLWWSRMATPMQAFLRNQSAQLRGKTLALVCTSGSSGISQTLADAKRLCPESVFTEALHIRSATVSNARNLLSAWLNKLGFSTGG
jgi:flavodoxin